MKKIFLFLIVFIMVSCDKKATGYKGNDMYFKKFFNHVVENPFPNYDIDHENVRKTINNYFKNNNWKVVFKYNLGLNKEILYFVVEEVEKDKYYNAIKKGIFIWENGEIHGYLDSQKGIYSNQSYIVDFEKLGLVKKVKYFVIGSYEKFSKMRKNIKFGDYNSLYISLIDYDDVNIVESQNKYYFMDFIYVLEVSKQIRKNEGFIYLIGDATSDSSEYPKIEDIKAYKKDKAEGKTVKSAAVKSEFARLLKAEQEKQN